jgi:hypothetical protein
MKQVADEIREALAIQVAELDERLGVLMCRWEDFVIEYLTDEGFEIKKTIPSHVWSRMRAESEGREIQTEMAQVRRRATVLAIQFDLPPHMLTTRLRA